MSGPPKAGVDWASIEAMVDSGASYDAAAKAEASLRGAIPLSRQAVAQHLKRRQRQRGIVNPDKLPEIDTSERLNNPTCAADLMLIAHAKRTPENAQKILAYILDGLTPNIAAKAVGISDDTMRRWQKDDAAFAAQIDAARGMFAAEQSLNVRKAAKKGDANSAKWFLERHHRDEYGPKDAGSEGRGITVVINVPRPEPQAIDITPMEVIESKP